MSALPETLDDIGAPRQGRGPGCAHARVHLDRLAGNLQALRAVLPPAVRVLAIVKADAYGHGAVAVSRALQAAGADALVVAAAPDGVALRQAGIALPILVLGPSDPAEARDIVDHGLTATVESPALATALSRLARQRGCRVKVHVRAPLGPAGFGVAPARAQRLLSALRGRAGIEVEGFYAHDAGAYRQDADAMDDERCRLDRLLDALVHAGLRPPLVHALSSPGVALALPSTHDAVRVGSLLYGIHMVPSLLPAVRPVMEVRAPVLAVGQAAAGSFLGYEADSRVADGRRIATLGLGYAAAPLLAFPPAADVLIRGRRFATLGRAFMNSVLVDVTDGPQVRAGDVAVLLGACGSASITAEQVGHRHGIRPSAVPMMFGGLPKVHVPLHAGAAVPPRRPAAAAAAPVARLARVEIRGAPDAD